jgi:hypothetical protein
MQRDTLLRRSMLFHHESTLEEMGRQLAPQHLSSFISAAARCHCTCSVETKPTS